MVDGVLTPLLVDRFQPHLVDAYRDLFGPDLVEDALRLPKHAFRGRLMLRRPGYRLKPHRDMRIAALTGLIYFARPGDSAEYGTDLYRIDNDQQAPTMKTFYPESCGGARRACALGPIRRQCGAHLHERARHGARRQYPARCDAGDTIRVPVLCRPAKG